MRKARTSAKIRAGVNKPGWLDTRQQHSTEEQAASDHQLVWAAQTLTITIRQGPPGGATLSVQEAVVSTSH